MAIIPLTPTPPTDYNTKQYAIIAGTEGGGISPSASRLYGPWESEDDFLEYLQLITGDNNPTIPEGVTIGVRKDDGTIVKETWVVSSETGGYWRQDAWSMGVICLAGVASEGISKETSTSTVGTSENIYYYEDINRFGLSTDGGVTFYPIWQNYTEFGDLDENDTVLPFNGRLYAVPSSGQMLLGTDADLEDIEGGISNELVAEIERLKALNIRFSGNTLSIYDEDSQTTKSYDLDQGGSSTAGYTYEISPNSALAIAGFATETIRLVITPTGGSLIDDVGPAYSIGVKTGPSVVAVYGIQRVTSNNQWIITANVRSLSVGSATIAVTVGGVETDIAVTVSAVAVESIKYVASSLAFNGTNTITGQLQYSPANATFSAVTINTADKDNDHSASPSGMYSTRVSGITSGTVSDINHTTATFNFSVVLDAYNYHTSSNHYLYSTSTGTRLGRLNFVFDSSISLLVTEDQTANPIYFPSYKFDTTGAAERVDVTLPAASCSTSGYDSITSFTYVTPSAGITPYRIIKNAAANVAMVAGFAGLNWDDEIYIDLNQHITSDRCYVMVRIKDSNGNILLPKDGTSDNEFVVSHEQYFFQPPVYNAAQCIIAGNGNAYIKLAHLVGVTTENNKYTLDNTATDMKIEVCFQGVNTGTTTGPIVWIKKN